tara:strand:+ start:1158 stop:1526 length:369 start_codon:yes stop_codon:yes gene_type:complete
MYDMKKLFQILVIIGISLSLDSCYYDSIYEPIADDDDGSTIEDVTFSNDIAPIFGFCSNCHDESQNPDLRDGNAYNSLVPTYVTANDAEGSPLYIKLKDGHQNLPASRLELVRTWIDQGAIE